MSETHELRLKIDAASAESGARKFSAAIASVRKAVKDLERDSTGAFKTFSTMKPEFDVTPLKRAATEINGIEKASRTADAATTSMANNIKRTALSSASALRTSEQAAQRLAIRMGDIGDTSGISQLENALSRLRTSLGNATDTLDVRIAKSEFDDLRSSLLQNAVAAEHLRGEQAQLARDTHNAASAATAHAVTLDSLRTKFNPLYAASQKYETALTEIAQAEKLGAISSKQASNAREEAARVLARGGAQMQAYGNTMKVAGHQSQNAAFQLQDVFVTAEMGMNPMRIAIQQGSQLSMVMNDMVRTGGGAKGALSGLAAGITSMVNPISLLTIGGVAASAMLIQWGMSAFGAGEEAQTFEDRLDTLSNAVSNYRQFADDAARSTTEFGSRFGAMGTQAKAATEALANIARLDAVRAADAAVLSLTERFGGLSTTELVSTRGGIIREFTATFYNLRDELNLTNEEARGVILSLEALNNAATLEDKVAAANALNESFIRVFGSVENIPPALLEVNREALNVALSVAEIEGAVDRTSNALARQMAYYAQTRTESNAAARTAQTMLTTLNAQAETNRLIATYGRDSLQVTQNRVDAERAAYRATVDSLGVSSSMADQLMRAWNNANGVATANMAGNIGGATTAAYELANALGIALSTAVQLSITTPAMADEDLAMSQQVIPDATTRDNQRNALANFRRLTTTPSTGGGEGGRTPSVGGGGSSARTAQLSEEQRAAEQLNNTLKDRLNSLEAERIELGLLASGQFETATAASLMAEAMMQSGGSVDEQTAAMIRQIDAAAALNEELQKVATDPVKGWMDSVPNWIEAGQQIEMGAINHVRDALSNMIQTGTFDIEALGEAILGTVADIVADKAMAELTNLLGRGEGDGLGGVLGGLFSSAGDAPVGGGADVAQGGVQAGQTISQAMVQAGQHVSQSISAAMMQGGTQAANSQRVAGVQHGQQVRLATTASGSQHATQVRTAITTAGQQHASMVGAASGGGMGGGFLDGLGGWGGIASMALGAFSEGGYSTSPVGTATVPAGAFKNAPHYSQGTANTSGIPAVLHPNEAVIPLSKGRKIPVDMGDAANGGNVTNYAPTYNISTPDADSFRKSSRQIQADGFSAAQRSASQNR